MDIGALKMLTNSLDKQFFRSTTIKAY